MPAQPAPKNRPETSVHQLRPAASAEPRADSAGWEMAVQQTRVAEGVRSLFSRSPRHVQVRVSDGDWTVIRHNSPAARLPGWKCAVDQPVPESLHALLRRAMQSGWAESQALVLEGAAYWVGVIPFPRSGYADVYALRMTDRDSNEDELRSSQAKLRELNLVLQQRNAELDAERARWQAVVEGMADEVWVSDLQGKMSLMNLHAVTAMGLEEFKDLPLEQVLEQVDILHPDGSVRPANEAPLYRSLSGEIVRGEEIMRHRRTGRTRYRQYSSAPTRDNKGRITGAVAIVRDITPLKQARQALEESTNRVNDILSSLGDGLIAIDREWKVIYLNHTAARIAGRPSAEMIGRSLWELWPELREAPIASCYRSVMRDRQPCRTRSKSLYTDRWYDISVYPSSEGITILYSDRTEQVQLEKTRADLLEENRQQRELLQAVFETDPSAVAVFTSDDLTFQFANRAYRGLLPIEGMDPVGKTLEQAWPSSLGFRTPETHARPAREGRSFTLDKMTRAFPDGSVRHFTLRLEPMSWQGRPAMLVVMSDITALENAKAQLEEYAEKLKRSNQDLQDFALIASHDLQEPLRKIEAFGSLLAERSVLLDEQGREHVERMRSAAARMRAMIEALLDLARVATQGMPFVMVDVGVIAAEVLSDLESQVRRTHGEVEIGTLPVVEGDPAQLRQLLQNLISNALKYHRPEAPPRVVVSSEEAGSRVVIRVQDNGIGFEPEHAERVFQPFERLVGRSEFEGSGMGLAICRRIVERHGGEIRAESRPRAGATFMVSLPRYREHHMKKEHNDG